MRSRLLSHALLAATLSSPLFAQAQGEPAVDLKKARATAEAAWQAQDYAAAAAAYKVVAEADAKSAEAWFRLGYALHATNKIEEALPAHLKAAEIKSAAAPVAMYNVACAYALLGKTDDAFAWLDKAVAGGFANVVQLRKDSDFDKIRADPRFAKVEEAMKSKAKADPGITAFVQDGVERRNSRIAWFGRAGSPGQVALDYSPVPWKDTFDKELASGKHKGEKWRLGADFWTRLDTSLDLQFGGVAVPAGYYYLTLEQRADDVFVLALHDAAAVRKLKLDAFVANQLKGGIEVTLAHSTDAKIVDKLELILKLNDGSKTDGVFLLGFGGHRLSAPIVAKIE